MKDCRHGEDENDCRIISVQVISAVATPQSVYTPRIYVMASNSVLFMKMSSSVTSYVLLSVSVLVTSLLALIISPHPTTQNFDTWTLHIHLSNSNSSGIT